MLINRLKQTVEQVRNTTNQQVYVYLIAVVSNSWWTYDCIECGLSCFFVQPVWPPCFELSGMQAR